ncbi:hypothetical protein WA158_003836 [Blastocystis sp. Blastoise]
MEQISNDKNWELIAQGAEGKLYKGYWQGMPTLIKERVSKAYRHPLLDKSIRSKRLSQEARSIMRCRRAGVRTPSVYFIDPETCCIYMEYVDGITLNQFISTSNNKNDVIELCKQVGIIIAKLHEANLIHGDLTTSNFLVTNHTHELVLIDFGLTTTSSSTEDKGVDLYVLERAFLSTHPESDILFKSVLDTYETYSQKSKDVMVQLAKVRARGRKRLAFG